MLSMKHIKASLVLAVVAVAVAGCGGGGGSSTSKFVGTWQYASGSFMLTFTGQAPEPAQQVTGTLTLSKGVSSDLVYNATPCLFNFTVVGTNAMINAGATCTTTEFDSNTGVNFSLTLQPIAWNLAVSGNLMTETGSGNCSAVESGSTFPCTFTQTATLNKISQ
jgi:hypothetical protein